MFHVLIKKYIKNQPFINKKKLMLNLRVISFDEFICLNLNQKWYDIGVESNWDYNMHLTGILDSHSLPPSSFIIAMALYLWYE